MKKRISFVWMAVFLFVTLFALENIWAQMKNDSSACSSSGRAINSVPFVGAYMSSHVVGLNPPPDYCYEPDAYSTFYAGQQVMSWVNLYDLLIGESVHWDWYGPGGYHATSDNTVSATDQCWWSWFDCGISNIPGQWYVEFYLGGTKMFTDYFTVIGYYPLSVSVNPSGAGVVTGSGIDCGSDCQENFWQDSEVTITAAPNSGWKFLHWDDGNTCYTANPITVTMNTAKNYQAKFVAENEDGYSLEPVDSSTLGKKTPLIFIHGNGGEKDGSPFGWDKYIKAIQTNVTLKKKYKVYLFKWNSNKDNLAGGLALGGILDQYQELYDKSIVIVAHSRGGLIARYFMNYYQITQGTFQGRLGGDKVKKLLTLATPHHGSPGADGIFDRFSFDYNHYDLTAFALCGIALHEWIFQDSYKYILWDDADKELTDDLVTWNSACALGSYSAFLMSTFSDISALNVKESYHKKIIAYGGNCYKKISADFVILSPLLLGYSNLVDAPNSLIHVGLKQLSVLIAEMPIIPNGYLDGNQGISIDNSYRPFKANDGMVPLISSLFLRPGSGRLFKVNVLGKVSYNSTIYQTKKQVNQCVIIDGADHLDFLTKNAIVKSVLTSLSKISN
jgi:pimeloyl-ACP methyl ester carboxylesterase